MLSKPDYELLAKYRTDSPAPGSDEQENFLRFDRFVQKKLVSVSSYIQDASPVSGACVVPDTWIITLSGEDLLLEYEKAEEEQRTQDSAKVKDRAFQIFLVFLTVVLTLLFEHLALPFLAGLSE